MPASYLQKPVLGEHDLFFISENSLWSVPLEGGAARRLVQGEGVVRGALLSPDGRWIAFAWDEEGSTEVYVMPAAGGSARRLTFHNEPSWPAGWSADSRTVYLASTMHSPLERNWELFSVPVEGGGITPLCLGHGLWLNIHSDGRRALLGKQTLDCARWKRYRGGRVGTIWSGTLEDMRFKPLLKHPAGHVLPQFHGERVYFISDRDGVGNIYSADLKEEDLRRHTHHQDFYARHLSVRGGRVAYQHAGDIFLLDLENGRQRQIPIRLSTTLHPEKAYFVDIKKYIERAAISADGEHSLFTIRGKGVSFPNWAGAPRILGTQQGVRYKFCQYLNREQDVLGVSDESGEERVEIRPQSYLGRPRDLGPVPEGRIVALVASHDGKKAAVATNRRRLYLLDLEAGKWRQIDSSRFGRGGGLLWNPAWSPDDRFLAYSKVEELKHSLYLYDTEAREIIRATDSEFDDLFPDFDPQGKYLYFTSLRNIDPYPDALDVSYAYVSAAKPYLMVLNKDTPVPFLVPHRREEKKEEAGPGGSGTAAGDTAAKADPEIRVTIDREGLSERIFAFPGVEAAPHCIPLGLKDRVLLASWPVKGMLAEGNWYHPQLKDEISLSVYDLADNRLESLDLKVGPFALSRNREWLIARVGRRYRVLKAGEKPAAGGEARDEKPGRHSGWLDLERIRIPVDLRREWRQIFLEAWRFQREHFWNQEMSGVDWKGMRDKYLPLLGKIGTREELDDLLWEVQGELGTSHAYSVGGDLTRNRSYTLGLLGADFLLDRRKGRYRIQRIYRGDSFYPDQFSPLGIPGVNVSEGEYLLAIGGREIDPNSHPNAYLLNSAGTEVVLTVSRTGSRKDAREVVVKTVSKEQPLRYREWVKGNIRYVAEQTEGRGGYFHLPDMSTAGMVEFDRYFYQNMEKQGLVIDIRANGGGYISQTLLQKLYRRLVGFIRSRWENREYTLPDNTFRGSLVVIVDESAGSDGDIFPQAFKNLKLGTVVGKRTWGGVVGIDLKAILVDRGVVTQPEYAIWFTDQGYGVENYGVDPDIEVENDPHSVRAGKDRQLEAAIKEVKRLMERNGYYTPEFEPIRKTAMES